MSKNNLVYEVILGIFYEVFENPQGGLSPKLDVGLGQALSFHRKISIYFVQPCLIFLISYMYKNL